ncbi:unnamed protein product [Amoebophrya sp. A120]|nr:unnamed protein product [Amoebophrya sp. A120]|eukprot:GSA120T00021721001.1
MLKVHLVSTVAQAARAARRIRSMARVIGLDCEGVALGRFGQLCSLQICVLSPREKAPAHQYEDKQIERMQKTGAKVEQDCGAMQELPSAPCSVMETRDRSAAASCVRTHDESEGLVEELRKSCWLVDALAANGQVVAAFRTLLEDASVVKVVHDCREDAAALRHQHHIRLRAVYDTQVAHALLHPASTHSGFQEALSFLCENDHFISPSRPDHFGKTGNSSMDKSCRTGATSVLRERETAEGSAAMISTLPSCATQSLSVGSDFCADITRPAHSKVEDEKPDINYGSSTSTSYLQRVKRQMAEDSTLWRRRPLTGELVKYAVHGCHRLRDLYDRQNRALAARRPDLFEPLELEHNAARAVERKIVSQTEKQCLQYPEFNLHLSKPSDAAKIGTVLWALCCAQSGSHAARNKAVYWKLNLGRTGVTSTPSALGRLQTVAVGDAVLCVVAGVSLSGEFLYLDRYDPDWNYHEFRQRPVDASSQPVYYGRECRHQTSALFPETAAIDPLLVRDDQLLQEETDFL